MQINKNILYYGAQQPLPAQERLQAGPFTLIFEAGDLRYIRLGETEVLRRLYWAVRDRNWGTPPLKISNLNLQHAADSFVVRYDALCQQGEIDFRAAASIRGTASGEIQFEFSGVAHTTFLRNRLGFCVLHPIGVAGARAQIEHVDGTSEARLLPLHIASQFVINGEIKPVIPFNEMRALRHEVLPGVWAEVRFAGDTFEMEDQRNWTDASFKTYCTPLRLPFPVEVKEGATVAQSVTLKLLQTASSEPAQPSTRKPEKKHQSAQENIFVTIESAAAKPLPRIGLGIASHNQPLNDREIERLRQLSLAHLRLDLPLTEADLFARLQRATTEAAALNVALEIALHLSDDAAKELDATKELDALLQLLEQLQPPIARWLIFHRSEKVTSYRWLQLARQKLAAFDTAIPIVGGTNIYFTELNSRQPSAETLAEIDGVAYSVNPQVHAFDNSSLVETLAAQAATATSARQFCASLPLFVSPITLQPRFNPNATGPEPEPKPGELPPQVDVRQMSLFGAGWTLGSIKQLAQSGEVAGLTYFETTGWRGVMERATGSLLPDKFHSTAGAVFPLYHVLAAVGKFANSTLLPVKVSDALAVEAMALQKGGELRVLLANMSGKAQRVQLSGLPHNSAHVHMLDERNVLLATQSPETFQLQAGRLRAVRAGTLQIEMFPYAFGWIDVE